MILCLGTTPAVQRVMVHAHVEAGEANVAMRTLTCAAGKATNVARVLKALAQQGCVMGFVGGETGQFIREDLDQAGIEHDFVTVAPPTRICITMIDESAGTATELIEPTKPVGEDAWAALSAKLHAALPRARLLVLSGSLPPQALPEFYADCVSASAAAGVDVLLDARGEPLLRALPQRPTIVKLNRSELAASVGFHTDEADALRRAMHQLRDRGARCVIVTLGSAGACFTDGSRSWRLRAPGIRPVSAIGSGDAFAAGLATGIVLGQPIEQAMVLAAACGASNALSPLPGSIRLDEVEALQMQVEIEPLDD